MITLIILELHSIFVDNVTESLKVASLESNPKSARVQLDGHLQTAVIIGMTKVTKELYPLASMEFPFWDQKNIFGRRMAHQHCAAII